VTFPEAGNLWAVLSAVFISYSHEEPDATLAADIARGLRAAGHRVFIDRDLLPGQRWGDLIDTHLRGAQALVVLVSKASATSAFVREEVTTAHNQQRAGQALTIVPVRIGSDVDVPYELRALLSGFQTDTWAGHADTTRLIESLHKGISTPHRLAYAAAGSFTPADRRKLIEWVRRDSIERHLGQTLANVTPQKVILTRDDSLVQSNHGQSLRLSPDAAHPVTGAVEVFDTSAQLLLLGAPGSGKTTELLNLAKALVTRAESGGEKLTPVPVIFNLSTWDGEPLERWLANELIANANAASAFALEWIAGGHILPLLDGLDEVAEEHRPQCVAAINTFRKGRGWKPLVVCCRTDDYLKLRAGERLNLAACLCIEPLTTEAVDTILLGGGPALALVREAALKDAELWNALRTPLMLGIVQLAYKNAARPAAPPSVTDVFRTYVARMFTRPGHALRFAPTDTRRWLGWLAFAIQRQNRTTFSLQDLGPDWAFPRHPKRIRAVASLLAALLLVVCYGATISLIMAALRHSIDRDVIEGTILFVTPSVAAALSLAWRPTPLRKSTLRWPGLSTAMTAAAWGLAFGVLSVFCLEVFVESIRIFGDSPTTLLREMRGAGLRWWGGSSKVEWLPAIASVFGLANFVRACWQGDVDASSDATARTLKVAGWALVAGVTAIALVYTALVEDIAPGLLIAVVMLTPVVVLLAGGAFAVSHLIGRTALWMRSQGPWDYDAFMEEATKLVFLRYSDGTYAFAHRLLLEHLARHECQSAARK
jgi:hypothetical protein